MVWQSLTPSCCPLNQCTYNLSAWASVPLTEALLTTTLHPAQMLGAQLATRKGQLREGFDADLCVMDWEGKVLSTWVDGREAYRLPPSEGSGISELTRAAQMTKDHSHTNGHR